MKSALTTALRALLNQPPRLRMGDFPDVRKYREARKVVARDRSDALRMLERVEKTPVPDHALLQAFVGSPLCYNSKNDRVSLYVSATKSYAMEYRRAVCMVLAAALKAHWKEEEMPPPSRLELCPYYDGGMIPLVHGLTAGEWLRRRAARELGDGTAARWFS